MQIVDNKICLSCSNHFHNEICDKCVNNDSYDELYEADPNCKHEIVSASGGGIKCIKCRGWFCF